MTVKKPLLLIVLDGWGYRQDTTYNAIANAYTPTWNRLWQSAPRTMISTSGMDVGLPEGQMGNSEVGHMTLGAGRTVYQSFTRINKAIADGVFFSNQVYASAIDAAVTHNKAVHILGLLSAGGVHSHQDHIIAAIELAAQRGAKQIYLHAFLDGRDTPPRSAQPSLQLAVEKFSALGFGKIASICGRFYAMDRDKRWDRVQAAYDALTLGKAPYTFADPLQALDAAYQRGEDDEFVLPTLIHSIDEQPAKISDGDTVLFMNFRPDRARQLTHAFVDDDFSGFQREARPALADFVMTTEYAADLTANCAFPPEELNNSLGEYLSAHNKHQLRIAETEKYAHVTFFFSGGREEPFPGEDRVLIPSPKVKTYDLKPEMSAPEVTEKLVEAIRSTKYDLIVCNYANCDQVGHTGNYEASIRAVEAVDACLQKVFAALLAADGEALVTADHGNVELMFDEQSNQPHTQHTTLPVPLIYVGHRSLRLAPGGTLADVAPTLLTLMGEQQPDEMTGRSLVEFI